MIAFRNVLWKTICGTVLLLPTVVSMGQAHVPTNGIASQVQYAFDVVSIRQSAKDGYSHWRTGEDGYSATNVTVQQLIFYAFNRTDAPDGFNNIISLDQIRGLPKWADSEQFDVIAKVDQQTLSRLSGFTERERRKTYQEMLQATLVERCQLDIHHEKQEQPVYLLLPYRDGDKLVQSTVPFDKSSLSVDRGQITARGYKIGELLGDLAESTGRIVVDQTHLTGLYDFQLKWRPDDETDAANTGSSLYTAVKEQHCCPAKLFGGLSICMT